MLNYRRVDSQDMFDKMNCISIHDVLLDSPKHHSIAGRKKLHPLDASQSHGHVTKLFVHLSTAVTSVLEGKLMGQAYSNVVDFLIGPVSCPKHHQNRSMV